MKTMLLPPGALEWLATEARRAYPRECCGLLEGTRDALRVELSALRPTQNIAAAADRFEIDPAEQVRVLRDARAGGRAIVGCYHSHPNGPCAPSPRDLDGASEENFLWLIAALDRGDGDVAIRAFEYAGRGFAEVAIASGADRAASR
jgi:proteasome lid subunit RPN8/RPN11